MAPELVVATSPVGAFGLSLELMSDLWLDGQVTGGRDERDRGWGLATRVGFYAA